MAHGAPDYSNVRKEEFVYRVDDMAELSARLNRAVSLERRGETVFFEDFSDGFGEWDATAFGTGAEVNLTADDFVSKGFAAELIGGSDAQRQSKMDYELPLLSISKIGLEVRVKQYVNIYTISISVDYYDGTTLWGARVTYWPTQEYLSVREPGPTETVVQRDIIPPPSGEHFAFMKLVFDANTKKYVRCQYNNFNVDISDYDLYTIADAGAPRMVAIIRVVSDDGENAKAVYDNIIVTRNET